MALVLKQIKLHTLLRASRCIGAGVAPRPNHLSRTVKTQAQATEEFVSARKTGLALMLDDGTRKSHSVAENTAFVTGFFKGIAEKESFARLVSGLYFVYEAMEDAFDKTLESKVKAIDYLQLLFAPSGSKEKAIDYQQLRHLKCLEQDVEYCF
eukprot:gene24517-10120_t